MKKLNVVVLIAMLVSLAFPMGVLAHDEDGNPQMGSHVDCPVPETLSGVVNIGAIFGLSGPISVYGNVQQQAVALAVEEINEMEYLGEGVTLEVLFQDSNGDAEQAINAMTSLIEQDGVVAVLGPTLSTEAFAADPVAQELGVPVMGVSNTASGITDMGDFVFRNSLPESSVIPGTVAQSAEALGLERVGILYGDDDDFTLSGYDVFYDALLDNDIEILREETFARGDVDFSAQLTNLISDEPDALIVSSLAAEAVQIIIQARELGYEGPIIGGNGLNSPAVLEESGADSDGVIVGAAWNIASPDPLSVKFADMYTEAYGSAPDQFSAQAYTGAWLMATAIRCADSTDSADVRDALASIEDFESPLGMFSFDEDRNPVHDPVVQIAEMGSFAVLGGDAEE